MVTVGERAEPLGAETETHFEQLRANQSKDLTRASNVKVTHSKVNAGYSRASTNADTNVNSSTGLNSDIL